MKKYPGQAIAIIMVILVVAAVIGASLYSRMIRNKGEVIDARESSKALEQSGNILDAFIATDVRGLQVALYDKLLATAGNKVTVEGIKTETIDAMDDLKNKLQTEFGTIDNLDLGSLVNADASCSKYKMTFEFAPPTEGIEYKVGDVMAINLSGVIPASGCNIDLTFSPSPADLLFAVKKVYTDGAGGYRGYQLADMGLYCMQGVCSQVEPTASFESWNNSVLNIDVTEPNLNEIRILPLRGKITIGITGSNECGKIFNQFLIKATSICSGQERTMQVIIPSSTNYGYDPMFDYTIYNSNGTLSPVVIP